LRQLGLAATPFVGYEAINHATQITALLVNGQPVERASAGQEVELVLRETPFYAEMGGQVGDTGAIWSTQGRAVVTNTSRPLPDLVVHKGQIEQGELAVGDGVMAEVGEERRLDIGRNHTATHLLQAALRQVLGEHVSQRGSLVAPERLRFDFSHSESVNKEELDKIQDLVNDMIRQNHTVVAHVLPYKQAKEKGAIALFGEKYGDEVRMVEVAGVSRELCGGTHLKATGEIGFFLITAESSIGAGLRRIEAVTGRGAESLVRERLALVEAAALTLQVSPEALTAKIASTLGELESMGRQNLALERELMQKATVPDLLKKNIKTIKEIDFLVAHVSVSRLEALGELADLLRERLKSGVIVLGTIYLDRPHFLAVVTKDLVAKGYHAGEIVKKVAQIAGGGGGGRPEFAQAGGKDKAKLDQALKAAEDALQ
ncbi:MAG: alanine--tRNA ligase-related protein, partial [Chloroflexota bacterium]